MHSKSVNNYICGLPGAGIHFLANLVYNTNNKIATKSVKYNEYNLLTTNKDIPLFLSVDRRILNWIKDYFENHKADSWVSIQQIDENFQQTMKSAMNIIFRDRPESTIDLILSHSLPFYTVHHGFIKQINTLWCIHTVDVNWFTCTLGFIKNRWSQMNHASIVDLINIINRFSSGPAWRKFTRESVMLVIDCLDQLGTLHDSESQIVYETAYNLETQNQAINMNSVQNYLTEEFWRMTKPDFQGELTNRDYFIEYPQLKKQIEEVTHQWIDLDYASVFFNLNPPKQLAHHCKKIQEYSEKNLEVVRKYSNYLTEPAQQWIQDRVDQWQQQLNQAKNFEI